jgi:glycosyltransferase involved in cell wall biosynthesis
MNNGTDFAGDTDLASMRRASRKTIGHEEHEIVFLFVGQMIMEKNPVLIMETLGALRDMDFTAYFVGQGYATDHLEMLSARLGISDRVHFTGTIYDRQLLKHYFAAADLFLFPSLYDNAPLVVREAAAAGTPSLLVEGATAAEIICDGVNGFLTQNSKDAMAAKIRQIMADRKLLNDVGSIASETVALSWEHIIGTVQQRYISIMQRKSRETERKQYRIPLWEKIWPEPVLELN